MPAPRRSAPRRTAPVTSGLLEKATAPASNGTRDCWGVVFIVWDLFHIR